MKFVSLLIPVILATSRIAMADPTPSSTPPALADANDEIVLKNGGMIRGTVTELEPGKSVSILVLGSGERRVFAWDEVEKVNRGAHSSSPSPAPTTPNIFVRINPGGAAVTEPPPVGAPGVVRFHIDADKSDVELRRDKGVAASGSYMVSGSMISPIYVRTYETVCKAPCDQVVDARDGQQFFFGGKGITGSSKFHLDDKTGAVQANVRAGSDGMHTAGYWAALFGGSLALIDGALFALDIPPRPLYGALALTGVVALGTGIIIMATSGTRYELKPMTF
jgi:hypothetical protein